MTINFTVWLGIALLTSVTANFFAFWYIRRVLGKLMFVGENLGDLVVLIENHRKHLQEIHRLEQYYGDDDIKLVISHTTSLLEILKEEYSDVYTMTIPMEIEEDSQEEPEQDAQTQIDEENVFYAGTRTSNN